MTWIPCCMGTAAACGCGKTLEEIKSYCTCRKVVKTKDRLAELEERVAAVELILSRQEGDS